VAAVSFSPDGKIVASGGADATVRLWEVNSGKELHPRAGHQDQVQALTFLAGGRSLVAGSRDGRIGIWEAATGRLERQFRAVQEAAAPAGLPPGASVAFARDGQLAAVGRGTIGLWDLATARCLRVLGPSESRGSALAFSPDGKTLAAEPRDLYRVCLWDVSTGQLSAELRKGNWGGVSLIAFSPDGKLLAVGIDSLWNKEAEKTPELWDVTSGKLLRPLKGHEKQVRALAFAPDGRTVATAGWDDTVRLWDVATGQQRRQLKVESWGTCLAFSADGRTLAAGARDGEVYLWEVATGWPRHRFAGHKGEVSCVAFGSDGRTLASGSADTTLLVWDVTGLRLESRPERADLALPQWDRLWADLASEDAARAYQALWLLAAMPERAVPLLRDRLRPAAAAAPEHIARLVADLDSDRFAVRQRAEEELGNLLDVAEAALRAALAGQPSVEVRRRIEVLLNQLDPCTSPERLRALRALEVLEQIGTPEAQQVLEKLAQGAPQARLTQEAKAALRRGAQRTSDTPGQSR
jgi:WD40 repeat protein